MDDLLLYLVLIPTLAVSAQWIGWRTNLPSILLLLVFGVALGTFVRPDQLLADITGGDPALTGPQLLFPLVSLAVAVIMFEGGLSLRFSELRESGGAALALCTLGAAVTMGGTTLAAHYCLDFGWRLSCLVGAILVVTGPTVIGPLLKQVRPSNRVANTLKWEGIVIDPIGAVLSVLVFEILLLDTEHSGVADAAIMLGKTAAVGLIAGVAAGSFLTEAIRRFWLPDRLHGIASLAAALLAFGVSDHFAHESGLIAVTVMGVWMTNRHELDIEHVVELQENLVTLFIGCLFIVLGSRVDLSSLAEIGFSGILFVAALIVLIRPISVLISLVGSQLTVAEKSFVAGLAPRGIVAAAISTIFALQLERQAGAELSADATRLSSVVFMSIIGTVAVYGLSATPLARWLGLSDKNSSGVLIVGADHWVREFALELKRAGCAVVLVDTNYAKVSESKMAGLEAVCANIANEHAREALPLAGIGQMMAMTPNDVANTLAVRECRSTFGRAGVYQLTFASKSQRTVDKALTGRDLFSESMTHEEVERRIANGWSFKSTALSEEFDYQSFRSNYQQVELLAVINERSVLKLNAINSPIDPVPGVRVIALVSQESNDGAPTNADDSPESDSEKSS